MTDFDYALDLQNVSFSWHKRHAPVLKIAEWRVEPGRRIFLHGASGSGKSTLLSLISGILVPTSGQIKILGTDLARIGGMARDRFRARHIGVIFQQFNLLPYLSVEANIELAVKFGHRPILNKDSIAELTDRLGLDRSILKRKASQLSVGQQQRVAVARALINHPELIIADEPTSSLDSDTRDEFMRVLLESAALNRTTVIFVSHDKSLGHYFDQEISLHDLMQAGETKA
ncbi:ABC transporter ATP-binding protein [Methylotuvimicrobium buryatense]|uniref:ABC transporter ATP-binding protein n=1 Tax=Methylotuvimicrobium buryatense TaxID=95641 RepID=A0A4P9UQ37_METBY|nr:ABC transporter ATP-binding protein [Methylotuvimicrobium buryatense]QCW83534.1 ABC transporter ATP-binding protein [Methylotuvimicrobium buryatense]